MILPYYVRLVGFAVTTIMASSNVNAQAKTEPIAKPVISASTPKWQIGFGGDFCLLINGSSPNDESIMFVVHRGGTALLNLTKLGKLTSSIEGASIQIRIGSSEFPAIFTGRAGHVAALDLGDEFTEEFQQNELLELMIDGDVAVSYSLVGSSAAFDELSECLEKVEAGTDWMPIVSPGPEIAEPNLEGPFPPSRKLQPIDPGDWVIPRDYLMSALRQEHQGVVRFRVRVGVDGRVQSCDVTGSSGHFEMDQHTCDLITERAHFEPATNDDSELTSSTWSNAVRWSIPE